MEIPRRSLRGRIFIAFVLFSLVSAISGCGGPAEPDRIGATGVDELVIPTPEPQAVDFVEAVDNQFLPLVRGSVWVYEASGGTAGSTLTVTVSQDTKLIDGVATTVVTEVSRDEAGDVAQESSRWLAQDRRGNVWNFGRDAREGAWEAGRGDAKAGLAMAAIPRVGDGYYQGLFPGVVEDQTTVLALDGEVSVPFGDFEDVVVTEDSSALVPGLSVKSFYVDGIGLVFQQSSAGERRELVSFTQPGG